MPILIWNHQDSDDCLTLIGVCEFSKRSEFEPKVRALCIAMDWQFEDVRVSHNYLNSVFALFSST